MKSFYQENVFNDIDFGLIKSYVFKHIESSSDFNYTKIYGRYWNTIDFNDDINNLLIKTARSGFDVDDLIDTIEGNRKYTKCIYVYNKIDTISIEEITELVKDS